MCVIQCTICEWYIKVCLIFPAACLQSEKLEHSVSCYFFFTSPILNTILYARFEHFSFPTIQQFLYKLYLHSRNFAPQFCTRHECARKVYNQSIDRIAFLIHQNLILNSKLCFTHTYTCTHTHCMVCIFV